MAVVVFGDINIVKYLTTLLTVTQVITYCSCFVVEIEEQEARLSITNRATRSDGQLTKKFQLN